MLRAFCLIESPRGVSSVMGPTLLRIAGNFEKAAAVMPRDFDMLSKVVSGMCQQNLQCMARGKGKRMLSSSSTSCA